MRFFVAGVLVGYVAWGHTLVLAPLALILCFVYLLCSVRRHTFLFAWGYYLAASRGLLIGTVTYYDKLLTGLLIWGAAALISGSVWGVIWSSRTSLRYPLFVVVQVLLVVPPVGYISWANPMTTAGIFFAGLGSVGFLMLLLLLYALAYLMTRDKPKAYIALSLICGGLLLAPHTVRAPTDICALNTQYDYGRTPSYFEGYQRQRKYLQSINGLSHATILLPENALGSVTSHTKDIWRSLDEDKVVLAGAHIGRGESYDNVLLQITPKRFDVVYRQRVPVPISMWRFWDEGGANAHRDGIGYFYYQKKKIGVLICYEQLIFYPYLQTFLETPDLILGISNLWWARGTSIGRIEEQTMQMWSLLYDTPMLFSYNG